MSREIKENSTNQNQRSTLTNITNNLGKRPLPFDILKPIKSNKITPNQQIPPKILKPNFFQNFQESFDANKKSTQSSNIRYKGNYFAKENCESSNQSLYFKHLMHEPGPQREASPESEDNLEEDSESDDDEIEKSNTNTNLSSSFLIGKNSENSKLDYFAGLDKSCNCSFCIKAEYMWMDLHYQDTRGRLSALSRSKRLARSIEGKLYDKNKVNGESSNPGAKMEFQLMQQWRSLFMHTENLFAHETSQLHSSLMNLEELREKCKKELNTVSGVCAPNK